MEVDSEHEAALGTVGDIGDGGVRLEGGGLGGEDDLAVDGLDALVVEEEGEDGEYGDGDEPSGDCAIGWLSLVAEETGVLEEVDLFECPGSECFEGHCLMLVIFLKK